MYSCLRGVSGWIIPLACGPGSPELSKSYMDMACKKKWGEKKIGHHAKPNRASATAPLCTWAEMCRTGTGAGSSAGADTGSKTQQCTAVTRDPRASISRHEVITQTRMKHCSPYWFLRYRRAEPRNLRQHGPRTPRGFHPLNQYCSGRHRI